jgi:hypothetical protein
MKSDMLSDEEETVSILSNKLTRQDTHKSNATYDHSLVPAIMIPISRQHSYGRQSVGPESIANRGSFYGRRDFENKHDDTTDIAVGSVSNNKLCRKPSTLDNVLTRIRSMRNSDHSDESEVDDESEADDDDDDYDGIED